MRDDLTVSGNDAASVVDLCAVRAAEHLRMDEREARLGGIFQNLVERLEGFAHGKRAVAEPEARDALHRRDLRVEGAHDDIEQAVGPGADRGFFGFRVCSCEFPDGEPAFVVAARLVGIAFGNPGNDAFVFEDGGDVVELSLEAEYGADDDGDAFGLIFDLVEGAHGFLVRVIAQKNVFGVTARDREFGKDQYGVLESSGGDDGALDAIDVPGPVADSLI